MSYPLEIGIEEAPCPLGCPAGDDKLLVGRDRLHDLPGEFRVVKCRGCGLMRTDPRPTQGSIGFYYPDEYGPYESTKVVVTSARREPVPFWKQIARRVLDRDSRKLPPVQPGRMLEIGCASGAFLHQMAGLGWEVEGLEFSERAAAAARSLGYPVHVGALESAPEQKERYDLIVGWHVLEHLHRPIHALEKLHRWSKSGTRLAISVPDAGALEFKIFRDAWYALDLPRHLYHYTPKTLSSVLARGGWKIEQIFWHTNPVNLLQSLRYRCLDHGWCELAGYLLDVVEGRRHRYSRAALGKLLGTLHSSGRMTVWARAS